MCPHANLRRIMEEVVLEVWLRGFDPHARASRYRWIMLSRNHAIDRLNGFRQDTDIALVSHKIYRLVEEK